MARVCEEEERRTHAKKNVSYKERDEAAIWKGGAKGGGRISVKSTLPLFECLLAFQLKCPVFLLRILH